MFFFVLLLYVPGTYPCPGTYVYEIHVLVHMFVEIHVLVHKLVEIHVLEHMFMKSMSWYICLLNPCPGTYVYEILHKHMYQDMDFINMCTRTWISQTYVPGHGFHKHMYQDL
jgi:hypothetical protein